METWVYWDSSMPRKPAQPASRGGVKHRYESATKIRLIEYINGKYNYSSQLKFIVRSLNLTLKGYHLYISIIPL
jgi:hypothetical protein